MCSRFPQSRSCPLDLVGKEQRFKVSDCLYTPMIAINKTQMDVSLHSRRGNSGRQGKEGEQVHVCVSIVVHKKKIAKTMSLLGCFTSPAVPLLPVSFTTLRLVCVCMLPCCLYTCVCVRKRRGSSTFPE